MKYSLFSLFLLLFLSSFVVKAEQIGEVSTTFNVLGANDKIVIEAFDDPEVDGVTCYLSRAKTGGVSGSIGMAEDTSDAGLSCRKIKQVLNINSEKIKKSNGKPVFKKSTSIWFKSMQVVRFFDEKRKTLVYLTYSNKLIDGSPKNSISVVPVTVD